MSNDNCADYRCEWPGTGEHTHIGSQPYLRKVMDIEGRLVDGATGEILEKPENAEPV